MPNIVNKKVGAVYVDQYSKYEQLEHISDNSIFYIKNKGLYIGENEIANYVNIDGLLYVQDASLRFQQKGEYLTEHQQLKTINNESIIGSGNITISGGSAISNLSELTNDVGFITANDTSIYATNTDVSTVISNLVNSAPETLDTLKELADALGNDADFASNVTNLLGNKVDKVDGKQLSTEDYTTSEKEKLASLENYNDSSIRNRVTSLENMMDPSLPDKLLDISTDIQSLDKILAMTANDLNSRIDDINGNFDSYYTKSEIDNKGYLTSYTETDPTVPAWAKSATKPTYTANEVGALPDTTVIPTKVSDLQNDSGFISSETDPIFNGHIASKITDASVNYWNSKQESIPNTSFDDWNSKQNAISNASFNDWNSKTSNIGTITEITMNGQSKGTSGVVNLGTVITEHQSLTDYVTYTYVGSIEDLTPTELNTIFS